MKLYIAKGTCSRAVQLVANELGLSPELVHLDVADKSTSNAEDFTRVNPLGYVPVLQLGDDPGDLLTETPVICSYLADSYPHSGLIPVRGTVERVRVDEMLAFIATEIAQKHIPLMRKLLTEEGAAWMRDKLVSAYAVLDERLADGRAYLMGDEVTVADAYVWATLWHERSGAQIGHLENLLAYIARIEARPATRKALMDEAEMAALRRAPVRA